jgi:hypothetical protein
MEKMEVVEMESKEKNDIFWGTVVALMLMLVATIIFTNYGVDTAPNIKAKYLKKYSDKELIKELNSRGYEVIKKEVLK